MRHVYIRGILALIWLAAAIYSAAGGQIQMGGLYLLLCAAFLVSGYTMWKNGGGKGGK